MLGEVARGEEVLATKRSIASRVGAGVAVGRGSADIGLATVGTAVLGPGAVRVSGVRTAGGLAITAVGALVTWARGTPGATAEPVPVESVG
ncbi:hypothetical protein OG426_26570 [Streptomyces canus]|uniref:hypothetical protein n=1 Tax=Streptomyces canus TaxID=58343 RepID=UPI002259404B|nr:hypothetical protein [Streptomyces canus]MCX4859000.1 hypothetical protein [Streptomyces canus]WSW35766.1 hypothetical protein OG426_26570 [Streptomyces canus]